MSNKYLPNDRAVYEFGVVEGREAAESYEDCVSPRSPRMCRCAHCVLIRRMEATVRWRAELLRGIRPTLFACRAASRH